MAEISYDVLGIGNAIVDVLAPAEDAFLEEHDMAKGAMTLIDAVRAEELYAAMGAGTERSGGSAANTVAGGILFCRQGAGRPAWPDIRPRHSRRWCRFSFRARYRRRADGTLPDLRHPGCQTHHEYISGRLC